jgi:hypothetical protein
MAEQDEELGNCFLRAGVCDEYTKAEITLPPVSPQDGTLSPVSSPGDTSSPAGSPTGSPITEDELSDTGMASKPIWTVLFMMDVSTAVYTWG